MVFNFHPLLAMSLWQHLRRWGGPGLIVLGFVDNSIVPITGSMDVLTIWLAARHREPWPYYAFMATLGALLGGYLTYVLAAKGGREAMEHRLSKKKADQISKRFERWGFFSVAVPALLPPPFPFVPFLIAAGALQYPRKKFLGALTLGRGLRYAIEAYLGFVYGRHILRFFQQYYEPALGILIGLAVLGSVITVVQYLRYRKHHPSPARTRTA